MPFASKRQARAAFAGAIPGFSKDRAHEWAHETPDLKKLPDRASAEKGKPTLRSKVANRHKAVRKLLGVVVTPSGAKSVVDAAREEHRVHHKHASDPIDCFAKLAANLSGAAKSVGMFRGSATPGFLKPPGPAVERVAVNPRRNLSQAIAAFKA